MKRLLPILIFLFSMSAFANTYFVQEATSIGVAKDDAVAATELIRNSLMETKNQVVGQAGGAKFILRPKLMKLGNAYMLTIDKLEGGTVKFSAQMKSATIEELDTVSKRLVRAVIDEVAIGSDARVDDVTETEANHAKNRKQALRRWYFGFGPGATASLNNTSTIFGWSLSYNWDMPTYALKLFMDGMGANFIYYGIGGQYYLSEKDTSLLFAANVGYGNSLKEATWPLIGETASGFALGGGVGYQFFRTSSVTLEILAHGEFIMNRNSTGNPAAYGLRLGLYF